ncbi:mitochondrial protein Pet127-domain-containing protein [Kalaharituber pfeilii]|nr:mitochondrial protein Pet127-domain-containing protein [Kalaharituber pfeilii]
MLNAIRRASSLSLSANSSRYVCIFCQRHPLTVASELGLARSFSSNASTSTPVQPSAELIKEIRTEIEAHRQALLKKKKGLQNAVKEKLKKEQVKVKKEDVPKAPKAKKKATVRPKGIPIDQAGQSLSEALRIRANLRTLNSSTVELEPIPVLGQPTVPALSHDLDRVLFNPGVYFLQDPRSKVYNFDPYLQKLMPVHEFQFEALSEYITSSRDTRLETLAKKMGKRYVGSTSSMTSILGHFHYLLSCWRPINPAVISKSFQVPWTSFTALQRAPQAIFLRWKDGVYAIDADKEFDKESVLTFLGKSMEKLLTLPPEVFEKYRRTNEPKIIEEETKRAIDTYHYSTLGDILMRSQLDAHDSRLPGTGMFDLKTRAVVSVRMDVDNFHLGSGYQIKGRFGEWESFEREYFDMIRAAFLKYSLQVRMGRMDGIFVAFHNTERIFGFQYISLEEMDAAIHQGWHSGIGDREFKLSIQLLNDILNQATEKYPERSLRIHVETRETQTPLMYIFIEPMTEEEIWNIQESKKTDIAQFLKELGNKKQQYLRSLDEHEAKADEAETESGESEAISEPEVEAKAEGEAEKSSESESESESEAEPRSIDNEEPDDAWAEQMAKQLQPETTRDLLAFSLKIKSFVNGKLVLRPDCLKPSDSWEVQYELEEIEGPRAWTTYKACQQRRQNWRDTRREYDETTPAGEVRDLYLRNLRELSKRGRAYIKEVEKKTKDAVVHVWKPKAASSGPTTTMPRDSSSATAPPEVSMASCAATTAEASK